MVLLYLVDLWYIDRYGHLTHFISWLNEDAEIQLSTGCFRINDTKVDAYISAYKACLDLKHVAKSETFLGISVKGKRIHIFSPASLQSVKQKKKKEKVKHFCLKCHV